MRPRFQPELVNGPFEDPALYVDLLQERSALLFDLGDIRNLPPRKLLRIRHVFISHTHMDHFFGFDWLLRLFVGRDKQVDLYGPPGLISQVAGKLAGYTWNLLHRYSEHLSLTVHEYDPKTELLRATRFCSEQGFAAERLAEHSCADGLLLAERGFRVHTVALDHGIPSLAFCLEEARHINVMKSRLEQLSLPSGPWLSQLRELVLADAAPGTLLQIDGQDWPLGELRAQLIRCTRGHKLGYVVDCANSEVNRTQIANLMQGADWLFIEAPFLFRDNARALDTKHLTARAAGEIAKLARVRVLRPFHFSTRYQPDSTPLLEEAFTAFGAGI